MLRSITTIVQFELMVAFMEKHGDLNKFGDGQRGRQTSAELWEQLTVALNSSGSGNEKSEEKWKKVWSDLKNKIKKRSARFHETGGGHAGQALSVLEQRVLNIMNSRLAVGPDVPKFTFVQLPPLSPPDSDSRQTFNTAPACSLTLHLDTTADTTAAEAPIKSEENWQNIPSTSRVSPLPSQCVQATLDPSSSESEPERSAGVSPPPLCMWHVPTPAPQLNPEQEDRQRAPLTASSLASRRRIRRIAPFNSPPGPLRRRWRQATAMERAAASFENSDREWRQHMRRRDEEERRFREESERRRDATERRWQDLFGRLLDVLERVFPPPLPPPPES